jgi:acyl-CoA thioesterase-2
MAFDLGNLLDCLDLRGTGEGAYAGDNYDLAYRRVFGGQLLGQTIRALTGTCPDKQVKSLTMQFTREGDPDLPVDLRVDVVQNGRSFATCGVTISQATATGPRTIAVVTASLHVPEDGPERADAAPDVVPPGWAEPRPSSILPWEVRIVDGVDLTDPTVRPPVYRTWMRIPDLGDHSPLDEPWVHQALLAHASESTIIGTALLPLEGISQADAQKKFVSAVTSHTVWFHAPVRMDAWLLIDQHSPLMRGHRVFGRADVWTGDGHLVASVAQESMVRFV